MKCWETVKQKSHGWMVTLCRVGLLDDGWDNVTNWPKPLPASFREGRFHSISSARPFDSHTLISVQLHAKKTGQRSKLFESKICTGPNFYIHFCQAWKTLLFQMDSHQCEPAFWQKQIRRRRVVQIRWWEKLFIKAQNVHACWNLNKLNRTFVPHLPLILYPNQWEGHMDLWPLTPDQQNLTSSPRTPEKLPSKHSWSIEWMDRNPAEAHKHGRVGT